MKSDPSSPSASPTPQQLTELNDALVTATELERIYAALARHPRVQATPGSADLFEICRAQLRDDLAVLDAQLENLRLLTRFVPFSPEGDASRGGAGPSPRIASFPDVEPAEPEQSVVELVRRAFHLEDFLHRQLESSLASARASGARKLELELKMIVLSVDQRRRLLAGRYAFARSKSVLVHGLRKQTTRFLSRIQGKVRQDID